MCIRDRNIAHQRFELVFDGVDFDVTHDHDRLIVGAVPRVVEILQFLVPVSYTHLVNVGLSWRSNNNIYLAADCNYYNNMYLSMSPSYRTDAVITGGMAPGDIEHLDVYKRQTSGRTP